VTAHAPSDRLTTSDALDVALTRRTRVLHDRPVRPDRDYVLVWLIASRRTSWSFVLDRAVQHALTLGRPLLVFEALRAGYPHAADRHHAFVIEGMVDNAAACEAAGVAYLPWIEPTPDAGRGLLAHLGARACVVVTDDWPGFFMPKMLDSASRQLDVRLELVDGNGLVPLAAAGKPFPSAYAYRAHLQRSLPGELWAVPSASPFARLGGRTSPAGTRKVSTWTAAIEARWPSAFGAEAVWRAKDDTTRDAAVDALLARLPIDHSVPRVQCRGGAHAAGARLTRFLSDGLDRYAEERSHPDAEAASGLSPWIHYGHVGIHAILDAIATRESWTPASLVREGHRLGTREGFWGMSGPAEAFLDELVTWRELGLVEARFRPDYDRWESLPVWARTTLDAHTSDRRAYAYDLAALEHAGTHDALWNAAQRELLQQGTLHNALRMLWGKKILEWAPSPRDALAWMTYLNDRWALDGRDTNSVSGIFWCLGRYDRPWAPERPVFGTIRYMSSENSKRKWRLTKYLERYGAAIDPASTQRALFS
jgi:deoxyribodipyrimidine photo-lyase